MTPEQFKAQLDAACAARYPGPHEFGWPFFARYDLILAYSAEQITNAVFMVLDEFKGDGYGSFARFHDGGQCIVGYLKTGDAGALIHPAPPDRRYAPADDQIQLSYLAKGKDAYGNDQLPFFAVSGARAWANFVSNPPYAARGVPPDTAKWLLINGFVSTPNDEYAWTPYRGLTISEAVIVLEKVNHPWAAYPQG